MLSANYNPMLLEKYKPSNTKEIIGNASQISQIKKIFLKWQKHIVQSHLLKKNMKNVILRLQRI